MSLKGNIFANYLSLAHVPNPSIPVSGFLERRVVPGGEGFGGFWDLCRFAVEADQGAEPAIVGVGKAVFAFQRTIKPELKVFYPC
ncbi:MAG: hypothetical protein WAW42_14495 [Candidatus Competibacteraceae bacterium]